MTATQARPLHLVAREIRQQWRPINYAAKPYVDAMACLEAVGDKYGQDDGVEIVRRFLINSVTWRGETARRVKAELKAAVGIK